jgi:hypothetical protein
MSTGQADRASVLTSACLRASGASPRHSASFWRLRVERSPSTKNPQPTSRARSSKRTVRLISGIALDECRVPERYRTRVPQPSPRLCSHCESFQTPEREVDRAARRFQFFRDSESVPGVSRWKRPARGLTILDFRFAISDLRTGIGRRSRQS